MEMDSMRSSIDSIMDNLQSTQGRREKLIKGTRDVIMLCSKSIVSLHSGKFDEASQQAKQARELLDELRQEAQADLYRYMIGAETELVEANALKAIISGSSIPSMDSLNVKGDSYILGLLDCVGELKRLVYDKIRVGKSVEANNLFALMEQIYSALFPFAAYDNIVPGVRRKLDVARILIEDTRAAVTEDSRRLAMLDAIDKLYSKLSKGV
ncbi:MAG: translin [Candidatus Nitrosomirales archaeon]|jgi:translin